MAFWFRRFKYLAGFINKNKLKKRGKMER